MTSSKTQDRRVESAWQHKAYQKVRRVEVGYGSLLRKVARHVGDIVSGFKPGDPDDLPALESVLTRYADILVPWAKAIARRMMADVNRRDDMVWREYSKHMGQALWHEVRHTPIGTRLMELQTEQVELITSLPLEAAKRVHRLTMEGLVSSKRYEEIVPEIMKTGEITVNRATLIARTEVGRVHANLTQARAEFVGSTGYIWRTVGDEAVRPSHKKLEGTVHNWNDPPICEADGTTRSHPGAIWNCRCYAEVVIPDRFQTRSR